MEWMCGMIGGMNEIPKYRCSQYRCDWRGSREEILTEPDPFNEGNMLHACPLCWEPDMCGTPTDDGGYLRTCAKHVLKVG